MIAERHFLKARTLCLRIIMVDSLKNIDGRKIVCVGMS